MKSLLTRLLDAAERALDGGSAISPETRKRLTAEYLKLAEADWDRALDRLTHPEKGER